MTITRVYCRGNHAKIYFVYIYLIVHLIWSTNDINLAIPRDPVIQYRLPRYVRIPSYNAA
jgi:hypothetical protein